MSEPSHFIPYVRTNEIYYLDPDAPLSRPSTQDNQYQKSHDCAREQELFDSDHIRDPLLNPKLVKNRDRQQAILKGLSELRQVCTLHQVTVFRCLFSLYGGSVCTPVYNSYVFNSYILTLNRNQKNLFP